MKIRSTLIWALLLIIFTCIATLIIARMYTSPQIRYISRVGFDEPLFEFQSLRIIGSSVYQQADIGECIETASHIEENNFESWCNAWSSTAKRLHAQADIALKEHHDISASELYLRASTYYRAAEFYLHGNPHDKHIKQLSRYNRDCFARAVSLLTPSIAQISIPYDNTTLPGYIYHSTSQEPAPTIIVQTGFDGTQEELYGFARAATKRGYTVITFEGPGQGAVIREQDLPFRADWEHVIQPVIDYIITLAAVDPANIVLYGISFGGYLAPRAACFDHRIKALIANGGIYDPLEGIVTNVMKSFPTKDALLQFIENDPKTFDKTITKIMHEQPFMRWFVEHGMYAFHADSPHDFFLKYGACSLKNDTERITATTLICDGDSEMPALIGQSEALFAHIKAPKKLLMFHATEGAGFHCQMGASLLSHQRILDWLDTTIRSSMKIDF